MLKIGACFSNGAPPRLERTFINTGYHLRKLPAYFMIRWRLQAPIPITPRAKRRMITFGMSSLGRLLAIAHTERVKASSNVVVLDDDVAAVSPNSAAVNKAWHSLVDVAQKASCQTRRSTGRGKQRRTS